MRPALTMAAAALQMVRIGGAVGRQIGMGEPVAELMTGDLRQSLRILRHLLERWRVDELEGMQLR